ncbi:endolytic transglycosylase MltG [Paenibacillus alvei]|uniref:endolytic transglycosylase MltG n=1 Tax=Paenibacillus alvei TaxID=44250 RepID=UPI0018CF165A|nr:endolytic transglycosylase MltG [Paenibacillus alvei]MBG9737416.1 aminodeoxychorismate lyase [Paenibacillus alvei]MBG9746042.1 aminodeoxychorismate lyase [Paenibacillus alvei]MCY9579033.1 endolytic transglycosylase MltG [Paenibacillus alvei]MCY9583461.1 endolytic transglycosylase MltG [Paenibacillus alvei]
MRKGLKIYLTISLVILLVAGVGIGYIWSEMRPSAQGEQDIPVVIEQGSGTAAIASQLEEQGIIRNALIFKVYLKWNGEGSRFQAGKYLFRSGSTYDNIIAKLNSGDVVAEEMVRFTIPEGYTVEQIADKLSKDGIVDKERFLKLTDDTSWLKQSAPLVTHIPDGVKLKHKLEGYLFPETYELKKGSSEEDIITRMVQETEKRLSQASPSWEADLKTRGLLFHEMMTLASLVEREAVVDTERPLIAGVIDNRIAKGMRLQIDATVQYALDKPKERLYYKDLEIDSPYNTYKIDKLPPGPISSPSTASIQAVLKPEASEYLYYVTKKDGSQTHLFAKTFPEHERNIEQSKKTAGQ